MMRLAKERRDLPLQDSAGLHEIDSVFFDPSLEKKLTVMGPG